MTKPSSNREKVREVFPLAFGWREFSTSDYTVMRGDGTGRILASAYSAKEAWASAARNLRGGK